MDEPRETSEKEINAYLDRIEELEDGTAKAVFLIEDEDDEDEYIKVILPTILLPEPVEEGEYYTITISRKEDLSDEDIDNLNGNQE
ncbi:MAG: hypothetical protein K6G55_07025 [Selenomonadaceae bacterium]|nr:hypothetical protein [Selenomonadaceae bacterium]